VSFRGDTERELRRRGAYEKIDVYLDAAGSIYHAQDSRLMAGCFKVTAMWGNARQLRLRSP
jgi:hypothetical protein